MPPFLRRELGRQLASASAPTGQLRSPSGTEAAVAKEELEVAPLRAGPRGVPQEALVVRPLPLDISKLPLETSQSESLLNIYAPNNQAFLTSSDQNLEPTLPGETRLITLPLEPGTPALQTKVRHWIAGRPRPHLNPPYLILIHLTYSHYITTHPNSLHIPSLTMFYFPLRCKKTKHEAY